jgi:hypothetical protein
MALWYASGDFLSSPAHVLVVPVNCQGVAGCGLALQWRNSNSDDGAFGSGYWGE